MTKTISQNNLGEDIIVKNPELVTFPALYSVEGYKKLMGASGTTSAGHTGIIIGKTKNNNGEDVFVVLHTWKGCSDDGYNSSIGEYVIPEDHVTYLNLSPYLI